MQKKLVAEKANSGKCQLFTIGITVNAKAQLTCEITILLILRIVFYCIFRKLYILFILTANFIQKFQIL